MSVTAANPPEPRTRAEGLDALRGLAILAMSLSGLIPFGVLPSWMYHAQVPPPAHTFDGSIPGITWVDLVFPLFLFAMGAAIPLAYHRRLEAGRSRVSLALRALWRGASLGAFGIYVQHIRPHVLSKILTPATWLTALLGFALLFPVLTRLPRTWSVRRRLAVRAAGWAGIVVLLLVVRYPDGSGFSVRRNDIIIMVLASVSMLATWLWLATPDRAALRLGLLGFVLALRLSASHPGWIQWVSGHQPLPWFFQLHFTKYLLIVVPGTVAGDWIFRWSRERAAHGAAEESPFRFRGLSWLCLGLVLFCVIGLKARWVGATTLVAGACCLAGMALLRDKGVSDGTLFRSLFALGCLWLLLGLFFEPYEGGIKKDSATVSYLLVTAGLALFLLIVLTAAIDVGGLRKPCRLLIESGQNPMIVYAGINSLLPPILHLTRFEPWFSGMTSPLGPWFGVLRAFVYTLALAAFASLCTRRRILWRT